MESDPSPKMQCTRTNMIMCQIFILLYEKEKFQHLVFLLWQVFSASSYQRQKKKILQHSIGDQCPLLSLSLPLPPPPPPPPPPTSFIYSAYSGTKLVVLKNQPI